jgi:hypothetical protein
MNRTLPLYPYRYNLFRQLVVPFFFYFFGFRFIFHIFRTEVLEMVGALLLIHQCEGLFDHCNVESL